MSSITEKKRKLSLFTVFLTFFVDNLGWAIVFPIFAPYFLDNDYGIFASDLSLSTRTTVYGIFLSIYPLAQFFGAPILGDFADRFGRKKALVITVFLTAIGYILSGWSMEYGFIYLLFFSRLFTGVFAGNVSICLASIVDLSKNDRQKKRYFNYFSAIAGFSFIAGSFLGGKLSDSQLNSLFTLHFPLYVAALISFLNLLFVIFGFEDTHEKKPISFSIFEGVQNIKQALKTKKIMPLYIMYFFFSFSWTLILQFTPVLFIHRFQFTSTGIGEISAFMGVCWALGSFLSQILSKKVSGYWLLEACFWGFTLVCLSLVLPLYLLVLIVSLGIGVTFVGMAWPLITNLISSNAEKRIQGKILGISQSMLSLATFLSPILAGLSDKIYWGMPFIIAAVFNLIAVFIYFSVREKVEPIQKKTP